MSQESSLNKILYLVSLSGLSEEEVRIRREYATRFLASETELEVLTLPTGPAFLDEGHQFGEAIDATTRYVATLTPNAASVLILAGALDPGIAAVRRASPIPVVGPGETSLFLAHAIGRPTSIVTVDEHAVTAAGQFVNDAPVQPTMASIRSMDLPVSHIVQDREHGRRALISAIRKAVEPDGARIIILGSMTLPTLEIEDETRSRWGITIIDPVRAAVLAAREILRSARG